MEPKVGVAKMELTGCLAEMEPRADRPEAERQDSLAQALLVVARPAPQHHSRASPEMAQG